MSSVPTKKDAIKKPVSASSYLDMRKNMMLAAGTLLAVGGINWGLVAYNGDGKDLFDMLLPGDDNESLRSTVQMIVYVLVFIAAIVFLLAAFVPGPPDMLNKSFFPAPLVKSEPSVPTDATMSVRVQSAPGATVTYWASDASKADEGEIVWDAYGDYSNSGIAKADADGVAVLQLRKPVSYNVPRGKTIPVHVHYRQSEPDEKKSNSVWSDIKTVYLENEEK